MAASRNCRFLFLLLLICWFSISSSVGQQQMWRNVAQGKVCNMTSYYPDTGFHNLCNEAINGNTNRVYGKGNCIHTGNNDRYPHWTVNLGRRYIIHNITIFPRDGYLDRMSGVKVSLDNGEGKAVSRTQTGNRYDVEIGPDTTAQYVTVSRDGRHVSFYYMNICEIQVWVCESGYYGDQCDTLCASGCVGRTCNSEDGSCTCLPGYYTSKCVASSSIVWTSANSFPDNVTVPACPGQNVTLPWNYDVNDPDEELIATEWKFQSAGRREKMIAGRLENSFFVTGNLAATIEYVPNAGIRLLNVTPGDSGTYSVFMNMSPHGYSVTNKQRARVKVSYTAITEDGDLHVQMEPGAKFLPDTNQTHVLLSCGQFKPIWSRRINVFWQVSSSNYSIRSTFYKNGVFHLALPNPLTTQNYTCRLDPNTPAAECVQPGSSILTGVSVHVKYKDATINLLEGKLQMMKNRLHQCEQDLDTSTANP